MTFLFTKMQGLGNDFVVINAIQEGFSLSSSQIQYLANRHFGIGFDQLLILESASTNDVDFNYRIFNSDGSEVSQCGNGARCIALYIYETELSRQSKIILGTREGKLELQRQKNGLISVNMGIPCFDPALIPFMAPHEELYYVLKVADENIEIGVVAFGNPHAVIKVENVQTAPVETLGPALQQHSRFPKSVNVGFMQIISPQEIALRVYERGAGETLACGSGACAAVVVGRQRGWLDDKVIVHLPGGQLKIDWPGFGENLWMTGPAEKLFTGKWVGNL